MDVAEITGRLNGQQRDIAIVLCGNAWRGIRPTPGIWEMIGLGLMHIDGLKNAQGEWLHCKARPTDLGAKVRAHLLNQDTDHD